jgi:hypothetical protein
MVNSEVKPMYVKLNFIKKNYGIGWNIIEKWVSEGRICSIKIGDAKQSARLYKLSDIEKMMESLSYKKSNS